MPGTLPHHRWASSKLDSKTLSERKSEKLKLYNNYQMRWVICSPLQNSEGSIDSKDYSMQNFTSGNKEGERGEKNGGERKGGVQIKCAVVNKAKICTLQCSTGAHYRQTARHRGIPEWMEGTKGKGETSCPSFIHKCSNPETIEEKRARYRL